jgi:cyclin-dependent kinase 12/13
MSLSTRTLHDQSNLSSVTPTMNPLHENGSTPPPEPSLPAPQRDWRSMTRTIAHYERIEQIGEGTYGQVYRARCKDTDQIVALKKIRVHHGDYWGLPPTILREIKILKRLRHPNLVQMVEVVSSKGVEHLDEDDQVEEKHRVSKNDKVGDAREGYKGNLFLVLEYVSHDLTGLMDVAYRFTEVQVKCIFKQLLDALQYMHDNKYVHRDIKSSNILIDHHFRLKLADFGLARCIEPPILDRIHEYVTEPSKFVLPVGRRPCVCVTSFSSFSNRSLIVLSFPCPISRGSSQEFTNKVITLWYRPPELLLGATRYGAAVDIWSAGCILAELILGKPLFTGKTDMEQLQLIFEMLGTPSPETWEGLHELKMLRTGEVTVSKQRQAKLRDKYQHKMSPSALNLIEKLLELDPNKRLTASRALNSRYFMSEPRAPDRPEELGALQVEGGHFHEFQTKKKRKEAKVVAEKTRQNALEMGKTDKQAQGEFDAVYRGIMERVAKEGLNAGPKPKRADTKPKEKNSEGPDKSRKDKPEKKRSSREHKEKDREARREKKGKDERKEDRKKEGKDRDREKDRSHRRRSDSEGHKGDDEIRRKRKREERERREGERKKRVDPPEEERKVDVPRGDHPFEKPVEDTRMADPEPTDAGVDRREIPTSARQHSTQDDAVENGSLRRRRSRSPRDKDRRRHRDERHKSRDSDRDRDRDRSGDRRRKSEGHSRDRDRSRHRGDRDLDDRERDIGPPGPDRDRDHDRRRDDRIGRDLPPPRGEFDFRDDFGPRGGPDGPPRGGPDFRSGPLPPSSRRDEMGAYGPASNDYEYRGPPGPGRGPPPPGYYDGMRRQERDRSPPRQGRGHRR